jgi:hypothetical protein
MLTKRRILIPIGEHSKIILGDLPLRQQTSSERTSKADEYREFQFFRLDGSIRHKRVGFFGNLVVIINLNI